VIAIFDPVTIGAGPQPAASHAAARTQWTAFVGECQSAANHRALVAFPILVVSVALLVAAAFIFGRRDRQSDGPSPVRPTDPWAPPWSPTSSPLH
jgi:hypothetical protein